MHYEACPCKEITKFKELFETWFLKTRTVETIFLQYFKEHYMQVSSEWLTFSVRGSTAASILIEY